MEGRRRLCGRGGICLIHGLNVMIVGVGGQGTLLASRVIGGAAVKAGYDVKVSEVHGMSQRGGSVVTYVRFGEKVDSPLIDRGGADLIICFERLEALRFMEYLAPEGVMIVNDQTIDPMPVIMGAAEYPRDILGRLHDSLGERAVVIDAARAAEECGDLRAVNIVLIGVMAGRGCGGIGGDVWKEAIGEVVPKKSLAVNLRAFETGYEKGRIPV